MVSFPFSQGKCFCRALIMPFGDILPKGFFVMKKELVWKMVQGQIGYDFKNLDLLQQAFTRRSYTAENGGENNEVLEFIGDKALDFVIVKLLIQKYGHLANGDPVASLLRRFCAICQIAQPTAGKSRHLLCEYNCS